MWSWLVGGFLVFLVMTMGAVAFAIQDSGPQDCDDYEFDEGNWTSGDDTDDEAAELARCDALKGKDRPEVLEMLGTETLVNADNPWKKNWTYNAGETESYSGTARQKLFVTFNRKGVVTDTGLLTPPGGD